MKRRTRLGLLGLLTIAGYVCLTPIAFMAALAQGYPADLVADPARLAVVITIEMAVLAVFGFGLLVACVEAAYLLQGAIRPRADLPTID